MSATNTPSKSKGVLLRLRQDEIEELVVRAGEIQAEEKVPVSIQDVMRRVLFPHRYPVGAA